MTTFASILAMWPDTGEAYLSTPLFADVSVDMNHQELAIAGCCRARPGPA